MNHPEDAIQRAVLAWLSAELPDLAERALHVPNGGRRGKVEAARLKGLGVRPGVPDLLILAPRRGYHGAALELKAKGRKPTREQMAFLARLGADGYAAGWADSLEAAQTFLRRYAAGTLRRAKAAG